MLGYVDELCRLYPSGCLYLGPSKSRYPPLYTAPIVLLILLVIYDIKCIVDELLDIAEDLTDKIIGDCKPLLEGLVGEYNMAICKSGFDVVGKCLGSNAVLHPTH